MLFFGITFSCFLSITSHSLFVCIAFPFRPSWNHTTSRVKISCQSMCVCMCIIAVTFCPIRNRYPSDECFQPCTNNTKSQWWKWHVQRLSISKYETEMYHFNYVIFEVTTWKRANEQEKERLSEWVRDMETKCPTLKLIKPIVCCANVCASISLHFFMEK